MIPSLRSSCHWQVLSGGQVVGSLEGAPQEAEFYPKGNGEPLQDLEQEWKGCSHCLLHGSPVPTQGSSPRKGGMESDASVPRGWIAPAREAFLLSSF